MKVGILTWYDVLNYGSVFQAYALQEQIRQLGCTPEILRHDRIMPDYFGNAPANYSLISLLKWVRNQSPNRSRFRKATKKKFESFVSFRNEYLSIGNHYATTDADAVLIGSDQVFDINGMYYPFQFGEGISCDRVATYAPSFGETTLDSLQKTEYYQNIKKAICALKFVNGRDANTAEILSKIRGEQVEQVIDPVLLFSFEKERAKWNKRLIDNRYCIIYTWGGMTTSSQFADKCKQFACSNNLKLVSAGEIRPWCDIQFSSASPIEFFELFMHADMVLTNMFHGTCFSLIMQRPFYSFVMPHNENKLGHLLISLGARDQLLTSVEEMPLLVPSIDYASINATLSEKRRVSNESLRKAIGIIK